jgi:hypothetical protein
MKNLIKIALSVLLLSCLADLPYGYFQFVRFAAMVGFAVLAAKANSDESKNEITVYIVLAILFQPFIKISLGREIWNFVDIAVAIGLILSILFKIKSVKN